MRRHLRGTSGDLQAFPARLRATSGDLRGPPGNLRGPPGKLQKTTENGLGRSVIATLVGTCDLAPNQHDKWYSEPKNANAAPMMWIQ